MSAEIKVEKSPAEKADEVKKENVSKDEPKGKKEVMVQFRYKNYVEVLPIVDQARSEREGKIVNKTVKARNFRVILDLSKPEDKETLKQLQASSQYGSSFWIVEEVDRKTDKMKDRALTLERLFGMRHEQLFGMLTEEELTELGLLPGVPTKSELIVAIIDNKKLKDR